MIQGALWLLDHVPARVLRRLVPALAALAVGGLIALLMIAPGPGPAARSRIPSHSSIARTSRPKTIATPTSTSPEKSSSVTPAAAAARRFLSGYLTYAYRNASARAIPAAARSLRQALVTAQARTPPAARRLDPAVTNLQVTLDDASDATAVASISDGSGVTYPLTLQLHATADGWQVTSLGDD